MADTKVKVEIDVATQAASIALKNFNAQVKQSDTLFDTFKGNLAAQFTFAGIQKGISILSEFGKSLISASSEAEQSLKNLQVALDSAGITSQASLDDLAAYSLELQNTTQFSEEAAQASLSLLASLTTLDKDGLKTATTAAADLAATLNIDLDSATRLIAKGVNGNVSAFQRYGIEVQKGATESENFANILKALSSQQGAATKQTETYAGAQKQLDNAQGELLESLGGLITKNPVIIASMKTATQVFTDLAGFVEKNADNITLFAKSLAAATVIVGLGYAALLLYSGGIVGLTGAFSAMGAAAAIAWGVATAPITLAIAAIVAVGAAIFLVVKYWDDLKIATLEATATVLDYGAVAAGVFSKSTADGLKEQAQSLRDQATATREAKLASEEKLAVDVQAEAQAEERAQAEKARSDERRALAEEDAAFALDLIKQSKDAEGNNEDRIARLQEESAAEQEILKEKLDNQNINYYDYQVQRDAIDAEFYASRQAILEEQRLLEEERIAEARATGLITEQQYQQAKEQLNVNYANNKAKLDAEVTKKEQKNKQELLRLEKEFGNAKLSAAATTFGAIADVAALGGEKQFKIAKAFNLAEAITSGILAVQKAAASAPPPFNIPPIIAATATSVANVARIVATKPSFATGGIVGGPQGASLGQDNTIANVRTGEMILNAAQQRNLFDIANTGNTQVSPSQQEFVINTSVQLDGVEIARAVSRQVADGFEIGAVV